MGFPMRPRLHRRQRARSAPDLPPLLHRVAVIFLFQLLLVVFISNAAARASGRWKSPYVVLCDAGSTGTRVRVHRLDGPNGAPAVVEGVVSVRELRPGLSSQVPSLAASYLKPSIVAAAERIPPVHRNDTAVRLFGTAGMRRLPSSVQREMYASMTEVLSNDPDVPFRIDGSTFRTIDGEEEGYYAGLAVNYLGGRIGSDLTRRRRATRGRRDGGDGGNDDDGGEDRLLGALDLGGSSAQIVYERRREPTTKVAGAEGPSARTTGDAARDGTAQPRAAAPNGTGGRRRLTGPRIEGRKVGREDFYVASLSGFGGNDIREVVNSYVAAETPPGGTDEVRNPCYFRGYETTVRNVTHVGTGNVDRCLEILHDVIDGKAPSSSSSASLRGRSAACDGRLDGNRTGCSILGEGAPPVRGAFYAMTLFYFAYDFARDVVGRLETLRVLEGSDDELGRTQKALSAPNPSLRYLLDAARVVCDCDLNFLLRHADWYDDFTAPDKVPYRCLESLYVPLLLRRFGFGDDARDVRFAEAIDGREVEWTLGAFLHLVNSDEDDGDVGGDEASAVGPHSLPSPQPLGVKNRDSPSGFGTLVVRLSLLGGVVYVLYVATRRSWRRASSRVASTPVLTRLRHSFNYDDDCFEGGHVKL